MLNVLGREEAYTLFLDEVMPFIREKYEMDGVPDWDARYQAWADWTDGLCTEGRISNAANNKWPGPWSEDEDRRTY